MQDLPFNVEKQQQLSQKSRISVSAEVFGKYHKKESFTPTIIAKPENIKEK